MKLFGIGIGPGDIKLLTIKALEILKKSDKVYVPQSDAFGKSLAYEIVKSYIDDRKISFYCFPMKNSQEDLNRRYDELAKRLREDIKKGMTVSYVTLGDPSIFSTFNYLSKRLKDIEIEIIPGIASFLAASAVAKMEIVSKGESFCVVEPEHLSDFHELSKLFNTIIVMKAYRGLKKIIELIGAYPQIRNAYLVCRAGLEDEKIFDLKKEIPPENPYLSIALLKIEKKRDVQDFTSSEKGESIEKESFDIIESFVNLKNFHEEEKTVLKRIIHASGDLEIVQDVKFSPHWKDKIKKLLLEGAPVVTDVEMVKVGIGNKYRPVKCFINDPEIVKRAREENLTRAETAIKKAFELFEKIIFVIGNAPTALLEVLNLKTKGKEIFVVGMPVGFVNAKESKERLIDSDLEYITIAGYKGGSSLAVATFNALIRLYLK